MAQFHPGGVILNGMIEPGHPPAKTVAIWGLAMTLIKQIRQSIVSHGNLIDQAALYIRAAHLPHHIKRIDFPVIYDVHGNVKVVTSAQIPLHKGKPVATVLGWEIGIVRVTWVNVKRHVRKKLVDVLRKQAIFPRANLGLLQKVMGTPSQPPGSGAGGPSQYGGYARRAKGQINKNKKKGKGPKAQATHKRVMGKLKKSQAR